MLFSTTKTGKNEQLLLECRASLSVVAQMGTALVVWSGSWCFMLILGYTIGCMVGYLIVGIVFLIQLLKMSLKTHFNC